VADINQAALLTIDPKHFALLAAVSKSANPGMGSDRILGIASGILPAYIGAFEVFFPRRSAERLLRKSREAAGGRGAKGPDRDDGAADAEGTRHFGIQAWQEGHKRETAGTLP
jgi:hypothetical protein